MKMEIKVKEGFDTEELRVFCRTFMDELIGIYGPGVHNVVDLSVDGDSLFISLESRRIYERQSI